MDASAELTAALGDCTDIREDNWPGPDWCYPAVRVAVTSLNPATDGSCHLTIWDVTFSIIVYSQPTISAGIYDASSLQCADICDIIAAALFGERLESAGEFFAETAINIVDRIPPIPEPPPGGWRGEVIFNTTLVQL